MDPSNLQFEALWRRILTHPMIGIEVCRQLSQWVPLETSQHGSPLPNVVACTHSPDCFILGPGSIYAYPS